MNEIFQEIEKYISIGLSNEALAIILFILGILFSYYLYRQTNIKRQLIFFLGVNSIFEFKSNGDTKVELSYKEQNVDFLCESYLGVYNIGKKVIRYDDIPKNNNIFISINNKYKFYDAIILNETRTSICSKITSVSENKIKLEFDYLDFKDGFLIKLVHNCKLNIWEIYDNIKVEGIVFEVPKFEYYYYDPAYNPYMNLLPFYMIGTILFGTIISFILYKLSPSTYDFIYSLIYFAIFITLVKIIPTENLKSRIFWNLYKSISSNKG